MRGRERFQARAKRVCLDQAMEQGNQGRASRALRALVFDFRERCLSRSLDREMFFKIQPKAVCPTSVCERPFMPKKTMQNPFF